MDEQPDVTLLPSELRHLAPLISRYAESDDAARSELLANASDEELRRLSAAPNDDWATINAFLDEYATAPPGPLQDLALAVDSFSQAALEARFELERRQ
jgi:hypothetical protein